MCLLSSPHLRGSGDARSGRWLAGGGGGVRIRVLGSALKRLVSGPLHTQKSPRAPEGIRVCEWYPVIFIILETTRVSPYYKIKLRTFSNTSFI